MESVQRVPKTELARNTRRVIAAVQRGHTALIESHGQPEAAIIDIVDYRIMRAALRHYARQAEGAELSKEPPTPEEMDAAGEGQERYDLVISRYLSEAISAARAGELLGESPIIIRDRFVRLQVPLRYGPTTMEEAMEDFENARRIRES